MNIWQLFLGPVWWITRAVAILITLHVGWFWELRNSAKLVLSSYSATWSESVVEVRGAFFGVLNLKHMFGNVNRAWCSVPFRYVLTSLVKSGNVCGCHTQLDWRCWCTPAPSTKQSCALYSSARRRWVSFLAVDVQGTLDSWNSERKNEVYQKNHFSIFEKSRYYSRDTLLLRNYQHYNKHKQRENVPNQSSLHAQPEPSTPTGPATNAPISGTHHHFSHFHFTGRWALKMFARAKNYIRQGQWYNVLR